MKIRWEVLLAVISVFLTVIFILVLQRPQSRTLPLPSENTEILPINAGEKETEAFLKKNGIDEAMQSIVSQGSINCHVKARDIGLLAYKLFDSKALDYYSQGCFFGYYHGAIEGFFDAKGIGDLNYQAGNICGNLQGKAKYSCLHGLGHAVLGASDYDLPKALRHCENIKDLRYSYQCINGVFMENILNIHGYSQFISLNDFFYPCNSSVVANKLKDQCYLINSTMAHSQGRTFAMGKCDSIEADHRGACYMGFGVNPDSCISVPARYRDDCVAWGVFVVLGSEEEQGVISLCSSLHSEKEDRHACYENIANISQAALLNSKEQKDLCGRFPDEFVSSCLSISSSN